MVDPREEFEEQLMAEALEARRRSDAGYPRRKVDTAMWGLVFAVVVQFGTIVWFAARLTSAVGQLDNTAATLGVAVTELRAAQSQTQARVETLDAILNERTGRVPR